MSRTTEERAKSAEAERDTLAARIEKALAHFEAHRENALVAHGMQRILMEERS